MNETKEKVNIDKKKLRTCNLFFVPLRYILVRDSKKSSLTKKIISTEMESGSNL